MSTTEKIRGWLTGRLPEDWFDGPPEVTLDREEITVVGRIRTPDIADDVSDHERQAAISGRIKEFRERTRGRRMEIARELEHATGRKVSWGVDAADRRQLFTTYSAPIMTRLRQPERQVLQTLVDAGVARSRSEALAWCVKLVGKNAESWLSELRNAMQEVERVRESGPEGLAEV